MLAQTPNIRVSAGSGQVIALAGNPNVGKSTVFNYLTGLHQHTGNWPGKTVANATGSYVYQQQTYQLVDVPGTYSLLANSREEEVARDFLCFGNAAATVIVVDATCLERNLNLVLQVLEVSGAAVVCLNLMDEAAQKGLSIDTARLSAALGVSVVPAAARSGVGMEELQQQIAQLCSCPAARPPLKIIYPAAVEQGIALLEPLLPPDVTGKSSPRWLALRLLENDAALMQTAQAALGVDLLADSAVKQAILTARHILEQAGLTGDMLRDALVSATVKRSEQIFNACVISENTCYHARDRRLDRLLTSKTCGIPIMLLLLAVIFWLTITGANYPSRALTACFAQLQQQLSAAMLWLGTPLWLHDVLLLGIYKTVAWVIAVMLPPMAIFFPLFTLLEDSGYLPRIAFNLDKFFKKAQAHGKQSLTLCMGFGCNACAVIGCRIIDSPRERLIAILTNNFVPCNGRFPTLIAIITMFFVGSNLAYRPLISTLLLVGVILLGVAATLLVSKLLSRTILKGMPSSFALELPPYRRPNFKQVLIRSFLDRTLFVLKRAIIVAAPAGLLIWLGANISVNGISLLAYCTDFLDPFARLMGLDGVILLAFLLGFPANEIVVPIILMCYTMAGSLTDYSSLEQLRLLLVQNGWTWLTALCTMLFCLFHFPCGTTCLTIKKETGSLRWTALAFALPTVFGLVTCLLVATLARGLGLV